MIDYHFNNESELRSWLEERDYDAGSPKAFCNWLQSFFDEGNSVTVGAFDEEYDYWACWELV